MAAAHIATSNTFVPCAFYKTYIAAHDGIAYCPIGLARTCSRWHQAVPKIQSKHPGWPDLTSNEGLARIRVWSDKQSV